MSALPPCTRHDRPGAEDADLRDVLGEASRRAGRDCGPLLRALSNYDGRLLATWRDAAARQISRQALGDAWKDRTGDGTVLHLVPSDEEYDYQEDVVDNGADD